MASPSTLDMLGRLVGFDTTSRNSNLALIEHVEAYLDGLGIEHERMPSDDGRKTNLFATIGPADRPGYVLSGHTDVVPVDGQVWSSDPFALERRDGRLYGRGACDMKGFVAVILALAPEMAKAELKTPIHLALSYDEEVGCVGVRGMLRVLTDRSVKPLGCFVGEPSSMQVVIGHKAKRSMIATARGTSGHSSRAPEFVNAVEHLAKLVTAVSAIGERLRAGGVLDELYDIGHSTAHVGTFHGGTALNIVPDEATIEFEFRVLPGDDADALVAEIQAAAKAIDADMKARDPRGSLEVRLKTEHPGLDTAPDADIVTLAKRFAGRNDHAKVAYGTEAGLFVTMAGIPTVVCGPGSIGEAHKADEFVEEAQLAACEAFVRKLIEHCSS